MTELIPFALRDAPALIERVFPAQKVSFEAQQERTAVQGQTLTGLGSYWKGRKPLILARALVLGSLLPQTEDAERDLEIFEALMAFDLGGLARRAVPAAAMRPAKIAARIELDNPWDFFAVNAGESDLAENEVESLHCPFDADDLGLRLLWRRDLDDEAKATLYGHVLRTFETYEERLALCKRPEELDQEWLYKPIWPIVNAHLQHFGVNAHSHEALVGQLGVLRFGRRPRVGDTFAGGGSIPFEAARIGCDTYASDLNPIACMLNWGNLNIIGASPEKRARIDAAQQALANAADDEITALGIEHDSNGNRAKAYLYCLETRCPETGWMIPLSPSWVISKSKNIVAVLVPDTAMKRFNIEIRSDVSAKELAAAGEGTVSDGRMVYALDGKSYSTPIKTLRGDFRKEDGGTTNRLRLWGKSDFQPRSDDIFLERLYCIQWVTKETLGKTRQATFFAAVTTEDQTRERKVESLVAKYLSDWQKNGIVPDMEIESGDKTEELIRTRGWTHWHHLFSARQLLVASIVRTHLNRAPESMQSALLLSLAKMTDWSSKLCRYGTGAARESIAQTFYNQAYNTNFSYGVRSFVTGKNYLFLTDSSSNIHGNASIANLPASELTDTCDYWITDPPYADAVNYHEIAEFFIAWLRKDPPIPFDEWVWDSRRALAIKGDGDDFRRGMIDAYRAMTEHMPDNGMQCVMFTHQSTDVWSDMVGIFWAAGLQVVAAWYIATETTSELKKGGYVQGTVTLMLRKRPAGDRPGFKQRILPAVRHEVERQISQMLHLSQDVQDRMGEPVFNDSDLQMAGYAAALKVLTGYTRIGDEDVTAFALRPRRRGEVTVVDEIVQQASEAANSLLVPEGISAATWQAINGVQRFYLRMLDMESVGASKLDNYQNFAKAFHVADYTRVMASMTANKAALKDIPDFNSRDLTDNTEIGSTHLGQLLIAVRQLLAEAEPQSVINYLQNELADFMEVRPVLIDLLNFLSHKSRDEASRQSCEVLSARLRNQRVFGQG